MKISSKYFDSLALLSCCATLEDHPTSYNISRPITVEHFQPQPIPAPILDSRGSSSDRNKGWVSRTTSIKLSESKRRRVSGTREKDLGPLTRSPHQSTSAVVLINDEDSTKVVDPIFKPLCVRFSSSKVDWSSVLSQVYNLAPSKLFGDENQSTQEVKITDTSEWAESNRDSMKSTNYKFISTNSNNIFGQTPKPNFISHLRTHSEPAAQERIKLALDEKSRLTKRLREIENDIQRKSVYLNFRTDSQAYSRDIDDVKVSEQPHPLKSAPTQPFVRPTGRSFSLSTHNIRPDWRMPQPPLPIRFHTSDSMNETNLHSLNWSDALNQHKTSEPPDFTSYKTIPLSDRVYKSVDPSQPNSVTPKFVGKFHFDQSTVTSSEEYSFTIKSESNYSEFDESCDQNYHVSKSGVDNLEIQLGCIGSYPGTAY